MNDKVTKVRAGLYKYTAHNGDGYYIENMQSPEEWGGEWMWYTTSDNASFGIWFDPTYTKSHALYELRAYYSNVAA